MATKKKTTAKIKMSELIGARPTLEKLAAKEMNAATAFAFAKFAREVLVEIQEFEKKRSRLFEELGERQEDGNIKIKEENEQAFQDKIKKLLDGNAKVKPFAINELDVEIAPADLVNILPLFK